MPARRNPPFSEWNRVGLWRACDESISANIVAPAGKPRRLGTPVMASAVSGAVVQRPPEAFKSHEGFLALSFIEADRADRMVEQRL